MESLIKDAIVEHLARNSLIRSSQHGFTAGRSCLTNLLEYMEELTSLVEEGHSVDMFYLDFSKAFDLVPHKRLLVKLRGLGIQGKVASWVEEWLNDRKQRVVLNGEVSDWGDILSGVVQGSVLGPTLFLCFINDLDLAVDMTMAAGGEQRCSIIKKFADDTKWGRVVESAEDRACFQAGLDSLQAWADTWQMQYNVDKCHILHVGKDNMKHEYQLGGRTLEASKWEKDVGVIINDDLKPSLQCARAAAKANQVLGQIARGVSYRDKETMLRLYKTYVRPHLEYCQAAWSPWLLGDQKILEQVQHRAVKLMTNLRSKTYEGKLKELGLTTLLERRKRGDMITMFRIMTGKDKVDPSLWFRMPIPRGGAASTRQNTEFLNVEKPLRSNWELRRNQFSQRVVDDWNLLPDWVKQATSVNSFKNNIDRHLDPM
jgi:ribonuclease P/MRP protein subunit RPP40